MVSWPREWFDRARAMHGLRGASAVPIIVAASDDHVQCCFDVLCAHFSGDSGPVPTFEDTLCPLFVTWNKDYRHGDLRLRGCIGTLEPRPLRAALKEYALTSALRDRRFPPVARKELASLHCTVSLLSAFEHAADCIDWIIGMHGLIIEFDDPMTGAKRSATFLPEVAAHENWNRQQTIDALIRKSGYSGSVTPEMRARLRVTRYRSTTATLTYAQYLLRVDGPQPSAKQADVSVPACIAVPA